MEDGDYTEYDDGDGDGEGDEDGDPDGESTVTSDTEG